jgi:hypothetical protein
MPALRHARAADLDRAHAKPELVSDHLIGTTADYPSSTSRSRGLKAVDAPRGIGDPFGTNRCVCAGEGGLDGAWA